MRHGYDAASGFLFSHERDFRFEGRRDSPPDGSFLVPAGDEARSLAELSGCLFLSGCREACTVVKARTMDGEVSGLLGSMSGRVRTFGSVSARGVKDVALPGKPVCLCGEMARSPAAVSEFCRMFPSSRTYVCSVVDELAAFGVLAAGLRGVDRPRRANLCLPDERRMDAEFVEFDKNLEGDGWGRMAYHVSRGRPVVNQMMSNPGMQLFYGRVLTDGVGGCGTYIVRLQEMDRFFPTEPLSVKLYGAMCVPVRMATTEAFARETGWRGPVVDVMCVSDMVWNLPTFAGFYRAMSGGKGFFGVSDAKDVRQTVGKGIVFRHDREYKVGLKDGRLDV
jgi:hypothetical protein